MFRAFTIIACSLAITNAHLLEDIDSLLMFQVGFLLLSGMAAFSNGSMKHRSVLDIMFLWSLWILITDQISFIPPVIAAFETVLWVGLIGWVYVRPYKHISMPISSENVCIAFYGGPNAPFLSRIASHIGYAFSSVAVVVNGVGARPSKSRGRMVETTPGALSAKGYVFIDTGIKCTPEMVGKLKSILGTKTGYGLFRFKCLSNLLPLLECLGQDWIPKGKLHLPSKYFKQCVLNVT